MLGGRLLAPYAPRLRRGPADRVYPGLSGGYFTATLHPWPSLWFLLPLLALYEGGILWLGGGHAQALRAGADAWLRWGLGSLGLNELYWAPAVVLATLLAWSFVRWGDRPGALPGVCAGMAIESGVFALGLWGLSRGLAPFLESFGVTLTASAPPQGGTWPRLVTLVGAGVYEELLFRMGLFGGLAWAACGLGLPARSATTSAAVASALAFAAAHHVGRSGEPFDRHVFVFRTLAGVYFAAVFRTRGFGVAAGAHTGYDLLVGIALA